MAEPSPSNVLTFAIDGENFKVLIAPPFFTGCLTPVLVYLKLKGFFLTIENDPFLTLSLSETSSLVLTPSFMLC
jgi:hypothetical protein